MKYKCLSLSCSFSTSISFPFAQKKRKKDSDEPPTANQFPGMTCMFVPRRLPFAFHLRDRMSSWPLACTILLSFFLFQHLSLSICSYSLQMAFTMKKRRVFSFLFPPLCLNTIVYIHIFSLILINICSAKLFAEALLWLSVTMCPSM